MRLLCRTFSFLLVVALVGGLAACDFSEQNYDYEPGNSLAIEGATEVVVPDTAEYYVRAFTIEKDYTWTVNGGPVDSEQVRRDGEFIDVYFTEAGTYTIEVDNGEHTGTLEVTAVAPEEE